MKSVIRNIRTTPKKMNLIAGMIRGKNVVEALNILKFTPKKAANLLYKAVYSAVKNAENNENQKKETLFVREIYVGKDITMKRFMPVSRGRAHPIKKRSSQVKIFLSSADQTEKTKPAKSQKSAAPETATTPAPEKKPAAKKSKKITAPKS